MVARVPGIGGDGFLGQVEGRLVVAPGEFDERHHPESFGVVGMLAVERFGDGPHALMMAGVHQRLGCVGGVEPSRAQERNHTLPDHMKYYVTVWVSVASGCWGGPKGERNTAY